MRRWATTVLSLLAVTVATGANGAKKGDDRIEIQPKYITVEAREMGDRPDTFVGKFVEIRDRFSHLAKRREVPKGVERLGLKPDTHIAFRTHTVTGSNMLCFAASADKQSQEVLEGLVDESPITLLGEVKTRLNNQTIFVVSKMFRGHVTPTPLQKRRLVITVKAMEGNREAKQYTIPELNKFYIIHFIAADGREVKLHFKAELR